MCPVTVPPLDPALRQAADVLTGQGQSGQTMPDTHWRIGPVTAVDTATGTATVTIGGTDVAGIRWLKGHQPAVADQVIVLVAGTDTLLVGSASTGADPGVYTPPATIGARVTTPTGTTAVASLTSAFASGSDVAVTWSTEVRDDGNMWTSGASTRLTVPSGGDGWYAVGGRIHFSGNLGAVGDYRFAVTVRMSGANKGRFQPHETVKNYANGWVLPVSDVMYAVAGDYFELFGFQDSGSAMSILTTVGEASNSFYAVRLKP